MDERHKFAEKKMRVGKNIADRRQQLALSQMRLAERVGIDAETIARFEVGADWPTQQTFEKLAAALNLELYDLLRKLPPFPKSKGREQDAIRGTRKTVHDKSISATLLTGNKSAKSLKP
ncbi:MAG: helix-turn-helix domain-containing protein [Gammaproteobacteria bacterium]|nr:helix-turn-helix domain-containing protein [Gammaproteobacteria bacterium]MBU1968685.1 helix-turn-helix domain-containing protein [Gammaproteobacteria bacterium]